MAQTPTTNYFMEDPREAERLVAKVDPASWVAIFLQPQIDKLFEGDTSGPKQILDVGCGPSALANAVASSNPNLHVTGVDASADRIAAAAAHDRVDLMQGDACSLEFADKTFDIVYCRFVLEYLPDKQAAINEMVRVTKPGGIVLLQDLDGQLLWNYPIDAATESALQQSLTALETTGFDPMVGRKLFHLLRQSGATDISVGIRPYHQIIGAIKEPERSQWELKLDIARSALRQLVSDDFAQQTHDLFMAHLDSPETLTYSNLFTVVGRVNDC